jgi:hypothetical protein
MIIVEYITIDTAFSVTLDGITSEHHEVSSTPVATQVSETNRAAKALETAKLAALHDAYLPGVDFTLLHQKQVGEAITKMFAWDCCGDVDEYRNKLKERTAT